MLWLIVESFFFPQWEEGQYYQQAYPWMRKAYFRRDDTLLSDINKEFQVQAADQWQDASCEVRRHAFGEGIAGKDTSECLGVFATRNIRPGEEIVVDKTDTWGCIGPGREGQSSVFCTSISLLIRPQLLRDVTG